MIVSAELIEQVAKLIALGRSGAQPDRVTAAKILAMLDGKQRGSAHEQR